MVRNFVVMVMKFYVVFLLMSWCSSRLMISVLS